MAKAAKEKLTAMIEVDVVQQADISFCILGRSPMIMNRFNKKAWQELLFPSEKRSRATMEQTLKHDPLAEFRGGLYRCRADDEPTAFHLPNGAFHGALAQVAVDLPGAARAQIERLTRVVDITVHLWGVPQMFMAMVRNSDINHTPDVRTRPIFPEWACKVTVRYVRSRITERTIANLLGGAGAIVGIGDWRGEKGGPYGAFSLVEENDEDFVRITKQQGYGAQMKAYTHPVAFDPDTEELYAWFCEEVKRREKDVPSAAKKGKRGVVLPEFEVIETNGSVRSENMDRRSKSLLEKRNKKAAKSGKGKVLAGILPSGKKRGRPRGNSRAAHQ